MEVGLFGFGKTGSIVAKEIIESPDCHLKWVVRKSRKNQGEFASHLLGIEQDEGRIYSAFNTDLDQLFNESRVDVIIDFSASGSVEEYKDAAKYGTRIVSAISNYDPDNLEHLKELSTQTAVLYSPNITLGINFLIAASKVLQKIAPQSDIEIVEEHFRDKQDVSGTALRIAEDLNLDKDRCVNSVRVGGIIGKHEVIFGLPNQTIRIIHESLNRSAFGQGAIYGAKWLMKKKKGLYTMEQALAINLG
ncbi:MAG: dihydrodipicolinate reductase [Clostridiales bacterium]|nr:dihydrodipicolinate reductase [Clostridiales bacterium]